MCFFISCLWQFWSHRLEGTNKRKKWPKNLQQHNEGSHKKALYANSKTQDLQHQREHTLLTSYCRQNTQLDFLSGMEECTANTCPWGAYCLTGKVRGMHRHLERWEERDQHCTNYINLKLSTSNRQRKGEGNNFTISSCEPVQVTLYLWTSFIHSVTQ